MDPNIPPDLPAPLTPTASPPNPTSPAWASPADPLATEARRASSSKRTGVQRAVLAAAVSAMLLVGGAVAVVSAASPEPSASTSPTVTDPSVDGTTPVTRPDRPAGGTKAGCPNDGSGGTSGSGGSSTTPDSSAAPTTDPSPAATPLS